MIKQIMIPVVAFAVTATGVSAFNSGLLQKTDINLTDTQIEALEEAHELRQNGVNRDEIKKILADAGLDQETMKEIRTAKRQYRSEMRKAVKEAINNEDYDAYLEAVADTPRANLIESESDFEKLLEAHELREAGDHEGAREIMSELGFEKPAGRGHKGDRRGGKGRGHKGDMHSGESCGFSGHGFHKEYQQSTE